MAPDLNSLPPSTTRAMHTHPPTASTAASASSNGEPNQAAIAMGAESPPSTAARRGSVSLQAAATMNAGLQREPPRRSSSSSLSRNRQSSQASGRRRSAVLHNLHLNDPSIPAPGEMLHDTSPSSAGHVPVSPQPLSASPLLTGGDPQHRSRAPSLGELHQELEAEQEAQVNRLLQMIRQQQAQLQQLQAAQGHPAQSTMAAEDTPPIPEQSSSLSHTHAPPHPTTAGSTPRSPVTSSHPRSSFDTNRPDLRTSRRSSRGASSPRLRSASINAEGAEPWLLGGATGASGIRDESAFYQAETQSLVRENQMLRHRIRELERQLNDTHTNASVTREPAHPSHLLQSTSVSEEAPIARPSSVAVTESSTPAPNTPKEE